MASARRRWFAVRRQGELSRRRRRRHAVGAGLVVLTLTGGSVVLTAIRPDGSASYRPLAGVGHGRGMSQVGAFDQALAGAAAEDILAHYYPGAVLATIAPTTVGVRLTADDNETLDVFSDAGLTVADRRIVPGQAAHLTPMPDGGANVVITAGCDGDVIWQGATADPWAYPVVPGTDRPAAEHLRVCGGGTYRGALGVALENGEARTVNQVDVDDYLMGVVPAEMQAGWADQGGAEALRAQAIAARSYALAEQRYPYAQTCDITDCQVYPGTEKEDPRAAEAVRATSGRVLLRDGRILRTEYSAAPGGGQPIDIDTLEVGPSPDELAPAPPPPADDGRQAVRGDSVIDVKYAETGGVAGPLGAARGPESLLPGRIGTYRMFDNGVIIATPVLGARVVDFATLLQVAPDMATTPGPRSDAAPDGTAIPGGTAPPNTASTPTPRPTVLPDRSVQPPQHTGAGPAAQTPTPPAGSADPTAGTEHRQPPVDPESTGAPAGEPEYPQSSTDPEGAGISGVAESAQ